jgi:hypothetical protein
MKAVMLLLVPGLLLSQTGGLAPGWELRKLVDELTSQGRRLAPVMAELRVKEWVAGGASETYVEQARLAQAEVGYLNRTAAALSRSPEKMTVALETFLRLQALEEMLSSLSQGVRKYQNPALADLLEGMIAENDVARNQLREYLVDLVGTKETELNIMNEEAQRCRSALIRQPVARPSPAGKKAAKP